jgi:predicted RNA-binding protein YlqC (UPF0109 family)
VSVAEELLQLVKKLVSEPEAVVLEERDEGRTLLFSLRVADQDLGKIIGRQGRTVRSLRTLLEARSDLVGRRFEIEILDGDESSPPADSNDGSE